MDTDEVVHKVKPSELIETKEEYLYKIYFEPGFYVLLPLDAQLKAQNRKTEKWKFIDDIKTGRYVEFISSHNDANYSDDKNRVYGIFRRSQTKVLYREVYKRMRHLKINLKTTYFPSPKLHKLTTLYSYITDIMYLFYIIQKPKKSLFDNGPNANISSLYINGIVGKYVQRNHAYMIFNKRLINKYMEEHNLKSDFVYTLPNYSFYQKHWDNGLLYQNPPIINHHLNRVITYPKEPERLKNLNIAPYIEQWQSYKKYLYNKRIVAQIVQKTIVKANSFDYIHPKYNIELPHGLLVKRNKYWR